jgi:hypothetical protein
MIADSLGGPMAMHVDVSGGKAVMKGVKYEWEWHKAEVSRPEAASELCKRVPL